MNKRSPWWLYPNLLSLDAPIVAVVWMWILAKSLRVDYVEDYAYWLVAASVWCVYVLDRIFDVVRFRATHGKDVSLTERHQFHWKYRKILLVIVATVVTASVYTAFNIASEALLSVGLVGVLLVLFYIQVRKIDSGEIAYIKNFMAGMIFAYGVSAPIIVESVVLPKYFNNDVWYHLSNQENLPFLTALVNGLFNFGLMAIGSIANVFFMSPILPVLFGLLCFLNITAIDLWEKSRSTDDKEEKESYEAMLGLGLLILVGLSVFTMANYLSELERIFCYVLMVAAAMLQLLNKYRSRFYLNAQRVLADLILILPVPLVWLLA